MLPMQIPAAKGLSSETASSYLMWTLQMFSCKLLMMFVMRCSENKLGPPIRTLFAFRSSKDFFFIALRSLLFFSSSNFELETIGTATMWMSSMLTTTGWFQSPPHGICSHILPMVPALTSMGRLSSYYFFVLKKKIKTSL